jgi:hypothetical protein
MASTLQTLVWAGNPAGPTVPIAEAEMPKRKTNPGSRSAKQDEVVPRGQSNEGTQGARPDLDNDDRDSRRGVSPTDASQHKGGARDATSTGGQQQGGPGSAPFPRFDRANDGGSAKNR